MKENQMRLNSSNPLNIIFAVFSFLFIAFLSAGALAFDPKKDLTNQQTYDLMMKGELILIDVRTKPEWQQSGVAKGAITLDMTRPDFLIEIAKIRLENPDKILGFICASGRRSTIIYNALSERGYSNIYSIFGGTTGNGVAGWIKDGFPVVKYEEN